jgi:hypothetical protein
MEAPEATSADTQRVRALALARGLDRALALAPDLVAAAVARGTGSLGTLPTELSLVTEPAVVFDPSGPGEPA